MCDILIGLWLLSSRLRRVNMGNKFLVLTTSICDCFFFTWTQREKNIVTLKERKKEKNCHSIDQSAARLQCKDRNFLSFLDILKSYKKDFAKNETSLHSLPFAIKQREQATELWSKDWGNECMNAAIKLIYSFLYGCFHPPRWQLLRSRCARLHSPFIRGP